MPRIDYKDDDVFVIFDEDDDINGKYRMIQGECHKYNEVSKKYSKPETTKLIKIYKVKTTEVLSEYNIVNNESIIRGERILPDEAKLDEAKKRIAIKEFAQAKVEEMMKSAESRAKPWLEGKAKANEMIRLAQERYKAASRPSGFVQQFISAHCGDNIASRLLLAIKLSMLIGLRNSIFRVKKGDSDLGEFDKTLRDNDNIDYAFLKAKEIADIWSGNESVSIDNKPILKVMARDLTRKRWSEELVKEACEKVDTNINNFYKSEDDSGPDSGKRLRSFNRILPHLILSERRTSRAIRLYNKHYRIEEGHKEFMQDLTNIGLGKVTIRREVADSDGVMTEEVVGSSVAEKFQDCYDFTNFAFRKLTKNIFHLRSQAGSVAGAGAGVGVGAGVDREGAQGFCIVATSGKAEEIDIKDAWLFVRDARKKGERFNFDPKKENCTFNALMQLDTFPSPTLSSTSVSSVAESWRSVVS